MLRLRNLNIAIRPLAVVAFLGVAAVSFAQQSQPAPPIRVSSGLVQIGVIARDKNGAVTNLTKDDFEVLDRGKPQKIALFELEAANSPAASSSINPLPPNTFSDLSQDVASTPNNITIVLLDNLNTLAGTAQTNYEDAPAWVENHALANSKSHLIDYITHLDPRERIAIYGLSDNLYVMCDFTNDRAELLKVLEDYDTTSKTRREDADPNHIQTEVPFPQFNRAVNMEHASIAARINADRGQITMAALQAIAAHVANIPGRKNLIWLTSNLPFSGQALAAILTPAQIAVYPVDGRGLLTNDSQQSVGVNADDAGINFTGKFGTGQSMEPVGLNTMRVIADQTGGEALVNTNDLTEVIRKAVEDSSVTYTLGFYAEPGSLDGRLHDLQVKVDRKGILLRYPDQYFAAKEAPATSNQTQAAIFTAVHSPIEFSQIPIQVRVTRADKPAPNSLLLSGAIDIHGFHLQQSGNLLTGAIELLVISQDQAGQILHEANARMNLKFTQKQYEGVLKSGVLFGEGVTPEAGATTVRVIVEEVDAAQIGSVIIPIAQVK
jgi:VWFA-related protein